MILTNKNAIIYGAGGSLGGAVAIALAAAGDKVYLTGRNSASVRANADKIIAAGGKAEVDVVDGFNEAAIANTAVFLASDLAAGITGVTVDVTVGTTAGLNYRAKVEK
jgi:3-oxoacyl-[acyl-carrier protein] reductase